MSGSVKWESSPDKYQRPLTTIEYKWKIENFTQLPKIVDTFYESPLFSYQDIEWCLRLFPNGESRNSSEGWIALYLEMVRPAKCFIVEHVVFGIEKINGGKEFQKGLSRVIFGGRNSMQGLKNFLKRDKLIRRKPELYPSDTLTISIWLRCEIPEHLIRTPISEKVGHISIGGPWKKNLELKGLTILSNDLKNIFLNEEDYDVTIIVKGKIFKAHKVILKARSEVLSSMLSHDMEERNSSVINIHDCEPGAFEIFLLYLYSGKAENFTETNMLDVYYISDKYNIPDLKAQCVLYIKFSMSVKTVFSIICLARKHGDPELLICATDYFILNVHEILLTKEWKLFIKDCPAYANELYVRAIKTPSHKFSLDDLDL